MARRTTNERFPYTVHHLRPLPFFVPRLFQMLPRWIPHSSDRTTEYLHTKWRLAAIAPVTSLHTYKVLFSSITRPLLGCICNVTSGLKSTTTTLLPTKWNPPMNYSRATSDEVGPSLACFSDIQRLATAGARVVVVTRRHVMPSPVQRHNICHRISTVSQCVAIRCHATL